MHCDATKYYKSFKRLSVPMVEGGKAGDSYDSAQEESEVARALPITC